jgi:choice-of-anchor A domain-containing protein
MNLTGVDPSLPVQKTIDVDRQDVALETEKFEAALKTAAAATNVVTIKRNQTLTLEVREAAPLYVVRLNNDDLQDVYKIERNGPSGPMVILVSGNSFNLTKVTMQEGFDPRQTLWYFDTTTTVKATQSLLRGSFFAPRASFQLASTRIDGALRAFHVVGDVKLTWHPMQIALVK